MNRKAFLIAKEIVESEETFIQVLHLLNEVSSISHAICISLSIICVPVLYTVAHKNNHLDFLLFLCQICINLNKTAADGNQLMYFKAV